MASKLKKRSEDILSILGTEIESIQNEENGKGQQKVDLKWEYVVAKLAYIMIQIKMNWYTMVMHAFIIFTREKFQEEVLACWMLLKTYEQQK